MSLNQTVELPTPQIKQPSFGGLSQRERDIISKEAIYSSEKELKEFLETDHEVSVEVAPLPSPGNTEPSSDEMVQAPTNVTVIFPAMDKLKNLSNLKKDFSLTLKYKTADDWAALKDKPVRAYYQGIKSIVNDKNELIQCGVFVTETECFLAGSMLIVEAVSRLAVSTPVEITYRGKSTNKNSDGSTMKFDVTTLA